MPHNRLPALGAVLALSLAASTTLADVKLADVFTDHMVLQRQAPVPVWGTADPGETVAVRVGDRVAQTTAGDDGKWQITLDPVEGPGPLELVVEGKNRLTLTDVLVGEVWICSGQSNMEWAVSASNNATEEIAAANYPQMRIFNAVRVAAGSPQEGVQGEWRSVTPETIPGFSAVGYFFGRKLHEELDVPIGLINSSWGGTPVAAWMEADVLSQKGFGQLVEQANTQFSDPNFGQSLRLTDEGVEKEHWAKSEQSLQGWGTQVVPGPFVAEGLDVDGVVWYRRTIEIPADAAGKKAIVELGTIDDEDVTYFNGVEIGRIQGQGDAWMRPRRYEIPAELVKEGENALAVRVFDAAMGGGFTAAPEALKLTPGGDAKAIPLAGDWRVAPEKLVIRDPDELSRRAAAPQNVPTALYNGMIAPLTPYAVRGFIWYQGESDAWQPDKYPALLGGMIEGWRNDFMGPEGSAPQPFLIVQLANFQARSDQANADPGWALLRQAQTDVANDEGNGLAVTIDIGEAADIHPRNKQDVGDRLARVALRDTYDMDVVASGPTLTETQQNDGQVVLTFEHADGLTLKSEAEKAFAVGNAEGQFVWATPRVEGQTVVLSFDGLENPSIVRYGWQNNPPSPLYNGSGLPAVPFERKID